MSVIIGSARIDERGKLSGGQAGDNNKKEVAMQEFYVHKKGWYIIRPKTVDVANRLAIAMVTACNNENIGYDQNQRLGVINYGVASKVKTEADCSSLVRACCIYAGFDPTNFTTANACTVLAKTNRFEPKIAFKSLDKTPLYTGDIICTKTKGHICIVTSGKARQSVTSTTIYKGVDYSPVFNANYYYSAYADLRSAIGADAIKLFNHFCLSGMKEGRQAKPTFNVKVYQKNYADLQKAFGEDLPKYYTHYCTNGMQEGRKAY